MKITLKADAEVLYGLTRGVVYDVLGIEADDYRIINDIGEPVLYPPEIFVIVDKTYPVDWVVNVGEDGELCAYPKEFYLPGFFEDWHDGDETARSVLKAYLARIEAAMPKNSNDDRVL